MSPFCLREIFSLTLSHFFLYSLHLLFLNALIELLTLKYFRNFILSQIIHCLPLSLSFLSDFEVWRLDLAFFYSSLKSEFFVSTQHGTDVCLCCFGLLFASCSIAFTNYKDYSNFVLCFTVSLQTCNWWLAGKKHHTVYPSFSTFFFSCTVLRMLSFHLGLLFQIFYLLIALNSHSSSSSTANSFLSNWWKTATSFFLFYH